jgi:hypothetical protein
MWLNVVLALIAVACFASTMVALSKVLDLAERVDELEAELERKTQNERQRSYRAGDGPVLWRVK